MVDEVLVIGGGVIGTSIAYHLAKRGQKVTLLERERLAAQASGASAGGVRQIGRDAREMPLAIRAVSRWHTLEDELEADVEFRQGGQLVVAESETDVPELMLRLESNRRLGVDVSFVEGVALREIAPELEPRIQWGIHTANDGQASAPMTTRAFGLAAVRLGATIVESCEVLGIRSSGGRITGVETSNGFLGCDWLVVAAGAWSNHVLAPLGHSLPLVTMALQMMAVGPTKHVLNPTVGAIGRKLSLKQVPDGHFVIGGGWPGDSDLEKRIGTTRLESIRGSIEHSSAILPLLARLPLVRTWIGLEALAQDEVPIIGPLPGIDNLTVAAGFSGHGFAISPVVGELIAELIDTGQTSLSLDAFGVGRFDGLELTQKYPDWQAG